MKWKDIEIDEIYPHQVSDKGDVLALSRIVEYADGRKRKRKTIFLAVKNNTGGYPSVNLPGFKFVKTYRVHRLVAKAFIPNPDNKPQVNHINGIRDDNRVENLEWATNSENVINAMERGTMYKPAKKLTKEQVKEIRELHKKTNLFHRELAEMFKISQSQISNIVNYKTWKQDEL